MAKKHNITLITEGYETSFECSNLKQLKLAWKNGGKLSCYDSEGKGHCYNLNKFHTMIVEEIK